MPNSGSGGRTRSISCEPTEERGKSRWPGPGEDSSFAQNGRGKPRPLSICLKRRLPSGLLDRPFLAEEIAGRVALEALHLLVDGEDDRTPQGLHDRPILLH